MAFQTDKQKTAAMPEAAGPTDPYQAVARDRRVDRTEDLNEEEIAAVEASEMEPGFEYLDMPSSSRPGRLRSRLASTSPENFGRAAMPPGDGRPTRRFATACSTIPDQDPSPARLAACRT
jgi:hypothetical protein